MVGYDLIENLNKLFNCNISNIYETYVVLEISFSCFKGDMPFYSDICKIFNSISQNDHPKLVISSHEDLVIKSKDDKESAYSELLESIDDDIEIDIHLTIAKNILCNQLSVYNFSKFSEFVLQGNFLEIIKRFDEILKDKPYIIFYIFDRSNFTLSTSSLFFTTDEHLEPKPDVDRLDRINVIKTICNYQSGDSCKLIPEDFHFTISNPENEYQSVFQRLETLLSMIYLSSISYLDNKNNLHLQLSGHLVKDYNYSLNSIDYNKEIYEIYKWVYTEGNPVDKVMLARNIISLHCRTTDLFSIDEKTFLSIKSNYALYLRDNVQQYMKVKSKFAEYVSNLTIQFGDLFFGLIDRFKNNIIAFFTFLIAVYFASIVQNRPVDHLFTDEIILITNLILLGSVLYMLISIIEMERKVKKIKNGYNILKEESNEILDQSDLDKIFRDDFYINNSINDLTDKGIILVIIWLTLIILCYIGFNLYT